MSNTNHRNLQRQLTRFAWLSIATAVLTMSLKVAAYLLTNSVGLLSDALESLVNLVTGVITLIALTIAVQPPDDEHAFGHSKAEYFSSGAEGGLIFVAAVTIIITSVDRLIRPQPLQQIDIGIIVSLIAALMNLITAQVLIRAGRVHSSVALDANARHLMSDVWTSASVVVGVGAAVLFDWYILDPIIALLVALRIMMTGGRLVYRAMLGLMDTALPREEVALIEQILQSYRQQGITFHALRTRQAGRQRFVTVHIQVPGQWTVLRGHTLMEKIEGEIRRALAPVAIVIHIEPLEDPASWQDISLNRDGS